MARAAQKRARTRWTDPDVLRSTFAPRRATAQPDNLIAARSRFISNLRMFQHFEAETQTVLSNLTAGFVLNGEHCCHTMLACTVARRRTE